MLKVTYLEGDPPSQPIRIPTMETLAFLLVFLLPATPFASVWFLMVYLERATSKGMMSEGENGSRSIPSSPKGGIAGIAEG